MEKFLADIREKEKSRRYILDMQARLHKAAETFTGYVGEIHAEQIDCWLSLMKKTSGRTKNNYRAAGERALFFVCSTQERAIFRGGSKPKRKLQPDTTAGGEVKNGWHLHTPSGCRSRSSRIEPLHDLRFIADRRLPRGCGGADGVRRRTGRRRALDQDVIELKAAKAETAQPPGSLRSSPP